MKAVVTAAILALTFAVAAPAAAQTKTLTGTTQNVTATVESIEQSSRELTLKATDGTYHVLHVPSTVKRFDELKVGDKLKIMYYENIVLRLKPPGEADVDTTSKATTPGSGAAGTMARQRTITATITAIDPKVPSITFSGPNKWTYSSKVEDKAALAKVKVGDKVDITWTTAAVASFEKLQ